MRTPLASVRTWASPSSLRVMSALRKALISWRPPDGYLWVKGDDGALLGKFAITGGAVPKTVTVPLFKTNELKFGVSPTSVWEEHGSTTPQVRIFDAYLDAE